MAAADLVLSDRESEVYYHFAVVAGERVQVEKDAAIAGNLHSNGDVDLKRASSVTGDVTAVGSVDRRGTVSGLVSEGAEPLGLPALLDEASARALADRVFEKDVTLTDEVIDDVVFVAGTVRIRGEVRGDGTVIATRDVRVDTTQGDRFSPPDEATRLSLIAGDDIRLGKDRPFRGVLHAGRDVDVEMGAVLEGVIVAGRSVHVKQGAAVTFVDFDQVPPEIELVSPADGSFLATATPEVRVAYSDDFSGLRLASVLLLLDGVDVTGQAEIGPAELTFTPAPLADGLHTLEVAVTDHSDNEAREIFSFTTDTVAPSVDVTSPSEEVLFNTVPPIAVQYADATSGVDLESLEIAVDGVLLAECTAGASSATCPAPALDEGDHTVTAEVRDVAGNAATASFSFELVFDTEPPELAVTAPTAPLLFNDATPEIAVTYSDAVSGVDLATLSLTIDGLDLVPGCSVTASGATCEAPPLAAGSHTVSAALSDAAGNAATASFSFELVFDTEPPALAVTAPTAQVLFNDANPEIAVTYSDAVSGVDLATLSLTIDGLDLVPGCSVTASGAICEAPDLAAGDHTVSAALGDVAGNVATASFSFELVFDTEPPALAVTAPADPVLFNDATPEIAVTYSDAVLGVDLATLSLAIDGLDLVPDCVVTEAGATCEAPELAAGVHTVSAAVSDAAGNAATASLSFELVFDTEAPTIALSAPDHITLERGGLAVASVEDDVAVAEVVFRFDGVELARLTAPPFEADFQAPEGAQAGDLLILTVEASDTAGNVASVSHEVRITAGGVVVGQVLSDETGHPLAGARVWAVGQEERVAVTDADGRYSLVAFEPQVVLRIESADGSTLSVERRLSVIPEVGTVAVDSRLRPLAPPVTVGAGGGTVEAEGISLAVPAEAMDADTPVRLTPLGPQGLPSLLPLGWSPLFAFDVEGPASFQAPVEATVDGLPPEVLHLVRYRRSDHLWVMVQPEVVVSASTTVVTLPEPGSYALLALDSDAGIPLPAAGGALPGVEAVTLPPEAVCEGEVVPPVLPPSGGTARGILSLVSPVPLPSGTVVRTEVTETFTLVSGTEGSTEVRSQDVVFYRLPAPAGAALGTEIPVVPVRTFGSGELIEARVRVEILSGRISERGRVGGKVPVSVTSGSATLSVATDSLAEDTAVSVEPVGLSLFVPVAEGLVPLAEVIVDLSGQQLAVPAELSVEGSAAAPGDSFLIARVERVDGVPHLVAVAAAELADGRVVSGTHPDLPGITRGGRYVVYRSSTSFGLVSGETRSDAGPVPALVETDAWPLAAVAGFDGRYTVAVRPGLVTLSARVPATSLAGSASVEVVAGQTVFADLDLAGATTTATVSPADGAIGVPVSAQVEIATSVALNRASVTPENVRLFQGPVADGLTVRVRLVLSASGSSLGVIPEAGLEPATAYTLVASGLADIHGGLVAVPTVSFTTKAEEPPQVDTDQLVLTFPDDDGLVRLLAPAGTLLPGTTILIVNTGNGVAVSFTVANDGSVTGEIPATIDDRLEITIVDPLGNVLNFERSRFVAQDGSGRTAIGPGGGIVEGPGGAELRIPEGALDQGAVFQVEPFGPDTFPERPDFPGSFFGGGLRVTAPPDLQMKKPGDLVFPKPPEAPDGAFYYVYRRLTGPEGQVGFEVIDHAFVEGEGADARVATASDPFRVWDDSVDGWEATADGQLLAFSHAINTAFYLMFTIDPLRPSLAIPGLITGNVTRAVFKQGEAEPAFEPLPDVRVRAKRTLTTIARSRADGTYAVWDPLYEGGAVEVIADVPGGTERTVTAFEADPDTTRDRKLPIQYRNIAIGNFVFPPKEPPVQVPAFETRVIKLDAEGKREDAGGIVVAGTPLIIGFRVTSSDVELEIRSVTILDQNFVVRADTTDDPLKMDFVTDFTPPAAGRYTVTAIALPPLGSPITVEHTFLAVAPGGSNRVSIPGPPDVVTELLIPRDGSVSVPVDILPTVVFTEPVKQLPGNVELVDEEGRRVAIRLSGIGVDAAGNPIVIEDLEAAGPTAAITSLTVRPVASLSYGSPYRLVLNQGIVDLDETPEGQPDPQPLKDAPRTIAFETFGVELLGTTDFFPGRGVFAFGQVSYVATQDESGRGWVRVYDISDPTQPRELQEGRRPLTGRGMDIAGEQNSPVTGGVLIVAGSGPNLVTKGPSNLFLFRPASAAALERVGVVSLTQAMEEGTILRVAVKGRHAYVITFRTTSGASIDVVDLERALQLHNAALAEGRSISQEMVLPGVGFGREAFIASIPVRATGQSGFGHLFGVAAGDFLFQGASQTLVLAVGTSPPLAVVDPVTARPVFTDPQLQSSEGVLDSGRAVALGILGDRRMAVVVGTGTGRNSAGTLREGPVLVVVDLTDPADPKLVGSLLLDALPRDVLLTDDLAVVGTEKKVVLVNLTDPGRPTIVGEIAAMGGRLALTEEGFLVSASQDSTAGGLRIAPLVPTVVIRRTAPVPIVWNQNVQRTETGQELRIEAELVPGAEIDSAVVEIYKEQQLLQTLPAQVLVSKATAFWPVMTPVDRRAEYFARAVIQRRGHGAMSSIRKHIPLLQIVFINKRGEEVMVPEVSDPRPVVTLDPVVEPTVTVTLVSTVTRMTVSGEVTDALADIVPQRAADIESVRIHSGFFEKTVPVSRLPELPTITRPYAFRGRFSSDIAISGLSPPSVVVVEAKNALGNLGQATVRININEEFRVEEKPLIQPVLAAKFLDPMNLETGPLSPDVVDSIFLTHGDLAPGSETPLIETGPASLTFAGQTPQLGQTVLELSAAPLATVQPRGGPVRLVLSGKLDSVGLLMADQTFEFVENPPGSGEFHTAARRLPNNEPMEIVLDALDLGSVDSVSVRVGFDAPVEGDVLTETGPASLVFEGQVIGLGATRLEFLDLEPADGETSTLRLFLDSEELDLESYFLRFDGAEAASQTLEAANGTSQRFLTLTGATAEDPGVSEEEPLEVTTIGASVQGVEEGSSSSSSDVFEPLWVVFKGLEAIQPGDEGRLSCLNCVNLPSSPTTFELTTAPAPFTPSGPASYVRFLDPIIFVQSDGEMPAGNVIKALLEPDEPSDLQPLTYLVELTGPSSTPSIFAQTGPVVTTRRSVITDTKSLLQLALNTRWGQELQSLTIAGSGVRFENFRPQPLDCDQRGNCTQEVRTSVVAEEQAELGSRKLTLQFSDGEEQEMDFNVTHRRMIVFAIDGLSWKSFQEVKDTAFDKLFGPSEGHKQVMVQQELTTFTPITYGRWATIFSGTLPSKHHVPSNSFLNRMAEIPGYDGEDKRGALDQCLGCGDLGLSIHVRLIPSAYNRHFNVAFVYDTLRRQGKTSVVIGQQAGLGMGNWQDPVNDRWQEIPIWRGIKAGIIELLPFTSAEGTGRRLDEGAAKDAIEEILGDDFDLLVVYLLGLDHVLHELGNEPGEEDNEPGEEEDDTKTKKYIQGVVTPAMKEIITKVERKFDRTAVYGLFSDHGHIPVGEKLFMGLHKKGDEVTLGPDKSLSWHGVLSSNDRYRVSRNLVIAKNVQFGEETVTTLVSADVIFVPQWGMAHVYVHPDAGSGTPQLGPASWTGPPSLATLEPIVKNIYLATCSQNPRPITAILVRDAGVDPGEWSPNSPHDTSTYKVYDPGVACGTRPEGPLTDHLFNLDTLTCSPDNTDDPFCPAEPTTRVNDWKSPNTGDIVLLANMAKGFYFHTKSMKSTHGSLTFDDALVPLAISYPGATGSREEDTLLEAVLPLLSGDRLTEPTEARVIRAFFDVE